jgi:hypothetical protein
MKRESVSNEVKVQRQIKALQKRIKQLEYDIIYVKTQLPEKVKPVAGFRIYNNDNT